MMDSYYLITASPYDEVSFLKRLKSALEKGIKLVQIRAKELNADDYKKLASSAIQLCHQYDAKALLNTHINYLEELKADGIHLPSTEMMKFTSRPISNEYIFSAACHNEEQIKHASKLKADLITLSPIFSTPSSPEGNPIGWTQFQILAKLSQAPVYALGGLTLDDLVTAKSHGAVGVAAIRVLWADERLSHLEDFYWGMRAEQAAKNGFLGAEESEKRLKEYAKKVGINIDEANNR